MKLADTLRQDLQEAIKARDAKKVATLRLLFAAIKNKEIEERKKEIGLGDEEVLGVVQKEVKKRKDAIAEYEKARREDLAQSEREELRVLEAYLPAELSDDEIVRILKSGVRELGASGEVSYGALMKQVMPTLKGKASGNRISTLAQKILAE